MSDSVLLVPSCGKYTRGLSLQAPVRLSCL